MQRIKVVLADDHTVVRQGLRALLMAEPDMEIVGEAENGRQAIHLTKQNSPDVVVMDIAMPVLNGIEATRQITRAVPGCKVLIGARLQRRLNHNLKRHPVLCRESKYYWPTTTP